jgi:predicted short-subunit dehydrogenase-like oxidoreductase (DUF2520 family)
VAPGAGALALKPVLHIAGCGRVGRSLARLWACGGVFDVGWVLNRSLGSAREAVAFIGAGTPVSDPGPVGAADWLMLAAPDGALHGLVQRLARELDDAPALAFHVSGAEPAERLRPLGCAVASVHPVCPFSDPGRAVARFAGSHALGEGDDAALDRVLPAFEAIGAIVDRFRPVDKRCYHAAAIVASNFLNVLDDLALQLAACGGLPRERALPVLTALQRIALDNIEQVGPAASLTGPIERADVAMCERLAETLARLDADGQGALQALARVAVDLAGRKHGGALARRDDLKALFADPASAPRDRDDAGV